MAEDIRGYVSNQIIRKAVGSPSVLFVFPFVTETVAVLNPGSTSVFYSFDSEATTGSTSGQLFPGETRTFDFRVGSVSVLSTTGSPNVECVGAR